MKKDVFKTRMNISACAVMFALSGCLPFAGCSSVPETPPVVENSKSKNFSMSQKKLLDIIDEQKKLFAKLDSNSKLAGSDLISLKSRIDGMWGDYIARNPDDFDGMSIYGKYLRDTDDPKAYEILMRADSLGKSASVKHQLAACEAESGHFAEAFEHAKESIILEPENPFYLLQAVQLVRIYRDLLVSEKIATRAELDSFIFESYQHAARLLPNDRQVQTNFALSFYDYVEPDWNAALSQWDKVLPLCALGLEYQTALANKARVLVELYRDKEAEEILMRVNLHSLQDSKSLLLQEIEWAKFGGNKKSAQSEPSQNLQKSNNLK